MEIYKGILDFTSPKMGALEKKAYRIWIGQRERCLSKRHLAWKNYGLKGIRVEYTSREFIGWCLSNKKFKTDSVIGRIDHSKNYSFKNIEVTTASENTKERNERLGNPTPPIKIICYNFDADTFVFFNSIREAHRATNFHRRVIKKQIIGATDRICGKYLFLLDNQ